MKAGLRNTISQLQNPSSRHHLFDSFHSTAVSLAKWKSKWDDIKDEGSDRQPSKPYVRYAIRQKRADEKRALNLLLNGKLPKHYVQDEDLARYGDTIGHRRKDAPDSDSKNSNRCKPRTSSCSGKGKHNASKRSRKKNNFYDDIDCEQPEPIFSATFGRHKCYTWSFGSWDNCDFQSFAAGFEWRYDSKWEKARKRVWGESDVDDESIHIGSQSHRIALGLPPRGPLKLDDVKSAFRASALKWHPDKHQGPSQVLAGERFKLCVDAYKSLCNALKST